MNFFYTYVKTPDLISKYPFKGDTPIAINNFFIHFKNAELIIKL